MGRQTPSDLRGHTQRACALHLLDVQDLAVVEHGQVTGLAGAVGQFLEEGLRAVDPFDLVGRLRPELPQLDPQPVSTRDRVLRDKITAPERAEQPMGGRLLQPERTAQLTHPELRSKPQERLEDVDDAVDDLRSVQRNDCSGSVGRIARDRFDLGEGVRPVHAAFRDRDRHPFHHVGFRVAIVPAIGTLSRACGEARPSPAGSS
jgi:hypothetical protein